MIDGSFSIICKSSNLAGFIEDESAIIWIYYLCVGAAAAHGRAQEDVHQQHYQEEHAQGDGQPEQPAGSDSVFAAPRNHCPNKNKRVTTINNPEGQAQTHIWPRRDPARRLWFRPRWSPPRWARTSWVRWCPCRSQPGPRRCSHRSPHTVRSTGSHRTADAPRSLKGEQKKVRLNLPRDGVE